VKKPIDDLLETFIAMIEAGTPPWRKPWANGASPSLPLRSDGLPFSGTNCWLLAAAGSERASPYWFTFKQALAIDAPVRKGEKGQHVILFKSRPIETANDDDEAETRHLRYLRSYVVFNGDSLDNLPEAFHGSPPIEHATRAQMRDAVIDAIPAEIIYGGDRAYYSRADDKIRLPPPEAFDNIDEARSTLLHEAAHWSGAERRLNREFGQRYGDEAYAFEELVAELTAALLGLHLRTPPQTLASHASYLASWARVLKQRPGALIEASGHAQRATDYLLAFSRDAHATSLAA
jgi:antirestriction protein ArdC